MKRLELTPFPIAIPDREIAELHERLQRTRWPADTPGSDWRYGTQRGALEALCTRWRERFDWRHWEAALNQHPGFCTEVDDVTVHFLHVRSEATRRIPLLLVHGWPSSVFEYLELIPMLTAPRVIRAETCGFDLVIPSLPGHGYSRSSRWPVSVFRYAELLHEVMASLGYEQYAAQGGDWGAYAASRLGWLYPQSVLGIHLSYLVGGLLPHLGPGSEPLSTAEARMLEQRSRWDLAEGGYEHLQCTKPQTLAYALTDSPAGLAGYLLEKWASWTDCSGDPIGRFGADRLLANISWYWFTQTGGSALRLYRDTALEPWRFGPDQRISVPTAVASFPRELVVSPREWGERLYDIQQWTDMPRGGHFAAIEEPALLADDIWRFFFARKSGSAR